MKNIASRSVRFARIWPISSCRSNLNIEWHCGINLLNGKIGAFMFEGDRASLWGRSRRGTAEISAFVRILLQNLCSAKHSARVKKQGDSSSEVSYSVLKISKVISQVGEAEAEYLAGCRDKDQCEDIDGEGKLHILDRGNCVCIACDFRVKQTHWSFFRQWTPLLFWSCGKNIWNKM